LVELIDDFSNGVVQRLDHRRVDRMALGRCRIGSLLGGMDHVRFCHPWGVDAEGPVIEEKGAILVLLKELACFLGHSILDMVARLAFIPPEGPGGEVAILSTRAGSGGPWEVDGKAMLPGGVGWWPQMPFAQVSGLIACVLKEFGKGDVVGGESREAIGDPAWPTALNQAFFQLLLRKVAGGRSDP
jgi:hypothetical protein